MPTHSYAISTTSRFRLGRCAFEADTKKRLSSTTTAASIADYVAAEVLPFLTDAWVDHTETKLGYEIPLTRYFYKYEAPRPLAEIDAELEDLESRITANLQLGAKAGWLRRSPMPLVS